MKKKILSLLLIASTLLAVLPMFAVGSFAVEAEPAVEDGNYDRLYVQDGLVSLLTTYDMSATDDLSALKDNNGVAATFSAKNYKALTGGLYIGANTSLTIADVIELTDEEGAAYTYQFVFKLTNDELANKTPATESQFSWEGAYAARPAFVAGPMNILVEPISLEAANAILANSKSSYIADYQFAGGIAKTYIQLYDTWHSDYDRTNIMPRLMAFEYGAPSSVSFAGATTKVVKVQVGKGENGGDLTTTTFGGSITSIYRDNAAVEVNPDRLVTNANYTANANDIIVGSDLPMVLYAVRAYDRELTVSEVNQNHFADIASYFSLDLTYFDYLSDYGKQSVYSAFAGKPLSSLTATDAQDLLNRSVEAVPAAYKYSYEELFVQDGLVANLSFASASSNDTCDVTEFKNGDKVVASFIRYSANASDTPTWTYGDGYLSLGLNGTLDMSSLVQATDDFTLQISLSYNTGAEKELFSTSDRSVIDGVKNASRAVSIFHAGLARLSFKYSDKAAYTEVCGVQNGLLHAWGTGTSTGYSKTAISEIKNSDGSTYLAAPLNTPFDITFTQQKGAENYTLTVYDKSSVAATGVAEIPAAESALPKKSIALAAGVNYNLHSVRVYDRVLNADEVAQNHFADLARHHNVALALFNLMDDAQKKTVYAQFANVAFTDTTVTQETIENFIASVYMENDLAAMAELLVSFKGFQMSTTEDVKLRALFALDKTFLRFAESGATVSVGIVTADAAATDLSVTIDANGVKANAAGATVTEVYSNKTNAPAVVYNGNSVARFASPVAVADYNAGYKFAAYVAITANNKTEIVYVDTVSPIFGDSVTAAELAEYFYAEGYTTGAVKTVYDAINAAK